MNHHTMFWNILLGLGVLGSLISIFLHESTQPWIFERYSLPYFILSLFIVASIMFVLFIYFRYKGKALLIYAGLVIVLCSGTLLIEAAGQIYASLRPSYRLLHYIPEKTLGWKLAPDLKFIYTAPYWYAREFSVPIKINSLGFRDVDRKKKKPSSISRIALMGDSYVEALQVPFSKTAGQLLQKKLNKNLPNQASSRRQFQVLNFGIGGYGTDQAFLTYLKYARKFHPDYVFLFFFDTHIWRTWTSTYCSNFSTNESLCMKIRPTSKFSHEGAALIRTTFNLKEFNRFIAELRFLKITKKKFPLTVAEYLKYIAFLENQIDDSTIQNLSKVINEVAMNIYEPKDYENFSLKQNHLIETEFKGARVKIRNKKAFLPSLFFTLNANLMGLQKLDQFLDEELKKLVKIYKVEKPLEGNKHFPLFEVALATNLKIISDMAKAVQKDGSKLILVDATKNIPRYGQLPAALVAKIMEKFCALNDIGYIPLHDQLNKSRENGESTRWKYDHHFNEIGNEIFSDSMFSYLSSNINN